jgi:hypothetical protein
MIVVTIRASGAILKRRYLIQIWVSELSDRWITGILGNGAAGSQESRLVEIRNNGNMQNAPEESEKDWVGGGQLKKGETV